MDSDENILYILKQLSLVAAAIEEICDVLLSPKRLPMGKVIYYRYLCLNLYLWQGYLCRLKKTSQREFAQGLVREFSQNICKRSDRLTVLRNCAAHYDDNCDMDVMTAIKDGKRIHLSEYLPPYDNIKQYFRVWYVRVNTLIADLNDCNFVGRGQL